MRRIGMWWVPLLLVLAPATGRAPAPRDVLDFFVPMRMYTAQRLADGNLPWLNAANGCGEAWYANPQNGVLYPPHWIHLALPTDWALTLEVAFHLALFALGVGVLATRWGADRWGRLVAEVAAWSAGPVLVTVGVLNNLETLAWIPWVVVAAGLEGRRAIPMTAVTSALAWLAGEPQVWALGVALAVAAAQGRLRAVAGVGLGTGVVAVQLVPFLFWVAEGDRGGAASTAATLAGALTPASWWGLVAPGVPAVVGDGLVYAHSLFLGAVLLVCAALGARRRPWVLLPAVVMAVLATLPAVGGGGLYLALTRGLVRYPARFALVGVACVLPLVGLGVAPWRDGKGSRTAAVVATCALVVCVLAPAGPASVAALLAAGVVLAAAAMPARRWLRDASLVVGCAAMVMAGVPLLGLRAMPEAPVPVWPEARESGRLYTPAGGAGLRSWLATGMFPRTVWQVGYLNLVHDVRLARTYAPVADRRLVAHLDEADRGPPQRWWLDTLSARWVVLERGPTPTGMEVARRRRGVWLYRNLQAVPVITVAVRPPQPYQAWQGVGAVVVVTGGDNRVGARIATPRPGFAWVSVTPAAGWRWRLDGRAVQLQGGPGILQSLAVPAGSHVLEGRYLPPALPLAGGVSAFSCLVLCYLGWAARRATRRS